MLATANEYERSVKAAKKQLTVLKKECRSKMDNYPSIYPATSTRAMQEAYGIYIECMKSKINILSKNYLINDHKGLPAYTHKYFMENLDKASADYTVMMDALFLNNVALLDPDTGEEAAKEQRRIGCPL